MDGYLDGTGRRINTFVSNFIVPNVALKSMLGYKSTYRAGILPGKRAGRRVSNQDKLADAYISLSVSHDISVITSNFEDVDFTNAILGVIAQGRVVVLGHFPAVIPADSFAIATYGFLEYEQPGNSVSVVYTSPPTR